MAAKAASDAAAAAETLADAEMYQETAEAEQAKAETALAAAEMYAGMVTQANEVAEEAARLAAEAARLAAEAAAAEAAALTMAREVADMAADAAEMVAIEAAAAVAAVASDADADSASYESAQMAAANAMAAAMAARDASDATVRATSSTDAAMHQTIAEEQRDTAASAQEGAMMYAGMVADAKAAADVVAAEAAAAAAEALALMDAQGATMDAMNATKMASDEAAKAVMDVAASKNLNTIAAAANARAEDARDAAAEAHLDAVDANLKAQAAMTSTEAAEHQAAAETAQAAAELASLSAMSFAQIVTDQQLAADAAATEAMMLADAKGAAMEAAEAARMAADEAVTAAAKVAELAGDGSAAAIRAQMLADDAEAAAVAAEEASARAQMDTSSGDAGGEQVTAVQGKMDAENNLATLTRMGDDAQVAYDATHQQLEARDLTDARDGAKEAADEALVHYNGAVTKAALARGAANRARAAARRAMGSRTDFDNANTHALAAEAAANKAEGAVALALAAKDAAHRAYMDAMAAETSEAAEAEQAKAEAANVIATEAHTGDTGAGMAYMAAKDAAAKAIEAGPLHVLALLKAANATSQTDTDLRAARVTDVAKEIADAAGGDGDADNNSATASGGNPTTVVASWLGDTVDDPATETRDEASEGMLSVIVDIDGSTDALRFNRKAVADDPDTGDDESMPKTVTNIGGLPGFMHGFAISDRGVHAIVYTNRMQGRDQVLATPLEFSNRVVTNYSRIVADPDAADGLNASDIGMLNATALYDHDGNSDTPALNVTFSCIGADGSCTLETSNEMVVGVVGDGKLAITFDGDVGVRAAGQNDNYLAFGFWLRPDSSTDAGVTPTVAAFFGGGPGFGTAETLTGKATYKGAAAGLYTEGSKVDFFNARATLDADFGKLDADDSADDQQGKISGMIDSIVAGGVSKSDVIRLFAGADNNIGTDGDFAGNARMGTPTVTDDVAEYPYNGTWEGQFYGPEAAASARGTATLPPSAAGTFGVTGTDDDVTRSYVGAFGANR